MRPSTIRAPICWSPPYGPLATRLTGRSRASASSLPVVPVAISRQVARNGRWATAQASRSSLRWS